ncbi:MAG: DUF924 family protein [Acetobacteraceae bacterium]
MTHEDVLAFWFAGDHATRRPVWFQTDAAFDEACRAFSAALDQAKANAFDSWATTPRGALALLILLDQMSRNLYRGTEQAFAADPKARDIARAAVAQGFDRSLSPVERIFLYLPFEHSEDLSDQDESVRLFEGLHDELGGDTLDYAHRHRDVIRRFGRFPHRNAALGRDNTAEEIAYLAEPGAGF